ncbi:MAG: T9SS type A sorting domain-containing protein [bacterium]
MQKTKQWVVFALVVLTAVVFTANQNLVFSQQPGPPPPMGMSGMPPQYFAAPGDTVLIPVEWFVPVPMDSQVSRIAMTVTSHSTNLSFSDVDTVKTVLQNWSFVIIQNDDSLRIEANAPNGSFLVKSEGPPSLLFSFAGIVSPQAAPGDSIELTLKHVSILSQGNTVAFPDSMFHPSLLYIDSSPPPPPGGGFELFTFLDTFSKPDSNFIVDLAVVAEVPADSQLSRLRAVVRAMPPLLEWAEQGHILAPELNGWSFNTQVSGDSLSFDLQAPAGTYLTHDGLQPLVLASFTGKVKPETPPQGEVLVMADHVILTAQGVEIPLDPMAVHPGKIMLGDDGGGPPPPPPGNGPEPFTFLDTFSKPDSNFIVDLAVVAEVPADSQLSRLRAVVRAMPPLLEWAEQGHILAPELNGWSFNTQVSGDSLSFDLQAPAGTYLTHDGLQPLVLASFTGKVKPETPPQGEVLVMADHVILTAQGVEIPLDPMAVHPGKIMLGDDGGGPPPPPFIPPATATTEGRKNLGLYGGYVLDMAFDEVHGVVLAAVAAPQSLFMSADSGLTWTAAFPTDSLEFITDMTTRGFGGRGMQVQASDGYCYARNNQEAGTLTGAQVSEDGQNWRTLMDAYLLQKELQAKFGNDLTGPYAVEKICAQGPVALVSTNNFVFRTTDAGRTWDISVVPDVSARSSYKHIGALELCRSNPTGNSFFVTLTDSWHGGPTEGFYKTEDGVTFTELHVSNGVDEVESVMDVVTHPDACDTLWVAAVDPGKPHLSGLWRSYDDGVTWTQVYTATNPFGVPAPKLYQNPNFPGPDNLRLIMVGENKYSDDLGDSWVSFEPQSDPFVPRVSNANAGLGHIPNTDIYFSQGDGAPARSTTGLDGTYLFVPTGIEGITIWDIAQVPNDMDKVYLATSVGIAYTSKFTDTTLTEVEKWQSPHGNYPINPNNGGNTGFTAIAIDPNNTDHVIAANGNAIFVTQNGGFTNNDWTETAYHNVAGLDEPKFKGQGGRVSQITFITSDSVIASIHCENMLYGALILSTTGGFSWSTMPQAGNHNFKTVIAAWNAAKDSLVLYAGGGAVSGPPDGNPSSIDSGAVYKSLDRGVTWQRTALTPKGTFNPAPFPLPVNEMVVKPGSLDTLYLACGENLSNAIVRSFDGGHTLESISMQAVGAREGAFEAVAINKHHPDSIYFAVRRDILVYDAIADSATTLFRGYPGELTHTLLYDDLTMGSSSGFYEITAKPNLTTGVRERLDPIPSQIQLWQNYPNPFNPVTNIQFNLPQDGKVKLEIFNILGQKVEILLSEPRKAGKHVVQWQPKEAASGPYFYRLHVIFTSGHEQILSKKLLFIK